MFVYKLSGCGFKNSNSHIINHEKKKEMMSLTYEEKKSYHKLKVCHICNKRFSIAYEDLVLII